jgi:radical SAM protein with 4Fe4S-binding SPASM domain
VRGLQEPPGMAGWDFPKEKVNEARRNGKMLMLYMDTTAACDLHCIYCQARSGRPLPNELSLEERIDVIDQALSLGCETIHIAGQGEPTIDPLFWDCVEYIRRRGILPLIFTHGMHITDASARRLFNLGTSIIIKVHSFDAENQDWLVGIRDYTKRRDEAIQALFNIGFNSSHPTRIGADTVITQQNTNEIPDIFRWARQNNVFPEIKTLLSAHRGASKFTKEKMAVSPQDIRELYHALLKIDQDEFGYTWTPRPPYVAWYCDFYYYHMYVNIVGDIMPCVGFTLEKPLGNTRENSLAEVWNSPFMMKIRNIDDNLVGVCASCPEDCYGCPCRRLLRTGDIQSVFESKGCWEDNL